MTQSYLKKGTKKVIRSVLDNQAASLITIVELWIAHSGLEWTCNRLKSIRDGIYQLRAGNPDIAREIWQHNSIAYDHDTLLPMGVYGYIGKKYLEANRHSVLRRLDTVLRLYTVLKLSDLSSKQVSKSRDAINAPPTSSDNAISFWSTRLKLEVYHLEKNISPLKRLRYTRFPKPDLSRLHPMSATHREGYFEHDLVSQPWGKHAASIWSSVYLPQELQDLNPAEDLRQELLKSGADSTISGHISFLQEGGCKARVVAVPNAWIQVLLRPLESVLDNLIRSLPESCNHDQCRGAYFLKRKLSEGQVYCFDLSSATDRFPLALQQAVLEGFGLNKFSSAIEKIAKGQWKAKVSNGSEEIWSYNTGQPMGMYCSFKLFHLTHILLLRAIAQKVTGNPFVREDEESEFCVLGDDVIISSPAIAEEYKRVMCHLGVELSSSKSIVSAQFGEFAGFVGVKTPTQVLIHRPMKFSGKSAMGSPMNLIYSLGEKVQKVSPWYAKCYTIFRDTIGSRNPDLSPIVSIDRDQVPGFRLNSHLLGSLSNRLSYSLSYQPSDKLLDIYELQQVILLGEKETVSIDGFSSKSDNLLDSTPRNLEDIVPSKRDCVSEFQYRIGLTKDPLFKQQRSRVMDSTR